MLEKEERERESERDGRTDRQTEEERERETDGRMDGRTDRQRRREREGRTEGRTDRVPTCRVLVVNMCEELRFDSG